MIDIKDCLTDLILSCVSPRAFDRIYNKRFTNTFRLIAIIRYCVTRCEFAAKYENFVFCIILKIKKKLTMKKKSKKKFIL